MLACGALCCSQLQLSLHRFAVRLFGHFLTEQRQQRRLVQHGNVQ
jgi:hypothetical protein